MPANLWTVLCLAVLFDIIIMNLVLRQFKRLNLIYNRFISFMSLSSGPREEKVCYRCTSAGAMAATGLQVHRVFIWGRWGGDQTRCRPVQPLHWCRPQLWSSKWRKSSNGRSEPWTPRWRFSADVLQRKSWSRGIYPINVFPCRYLA